MAEKETTTYEVSDFDISGRTAIEGYCCFGWDLESMTGRTEQQTRYGMNFGLPNYYVILHFVRDRSIPNYAELAALGKEWEYEMKYGSSVKRDEILKKAQFIIEHDNSRKSSLIESLKAWENRPGENAKKERAERTAREREEKERPEREAREKVEREAGEKSEREAKEAKEEAERAAKAKVETIVEEERKKNGKKWKPGVIIHLCLCAAYLFILYGTDIISAPWKATGFNFIRYLPFIIFSLAIGMVSLIFLKRSNYGSGIWVLLVMILVQSITICVWKGNVGILLIYLIGRILISFLCAIPGMIFVFKEIVEAK